MKPFIDIGTSWDKLVDITTDNLQITTGFQLSVKSIIFFRYNVELGLELYSTKLSKEIRLNPFIKYNL